LYIALFALVIVFALSIWIPWLFPTGPNPEIPTPGIITLSPED
jgi:hypothetical protein